MKRNSLVIMNEERIKFQLTRLEGTELQLIEINKPQNRLVWTIAAFTIAFVIESIVVLQFLPDQTVVLGL